VLAEAAVLEEEDVEVGVVGSVSLEASSAVLSLHPTIVAANTMPSTMPRLHILIFMSER